MPLKVRSILFLPLLFFLESTYGNVIVTPIPSTLDPLGAIASAGNSLLDPLTTNAIEDAFFAKVKSVLAHNLIPRFKIPRGNLSYLANPHWEVLYFLKYGRFPITADKNAKNSTARLYDRLKHIKNILDRKSDMLDEFMEKAIQELGKEEADSLDTNYSSSREGMQMPMFDPELFFTFQGPLGTFFPTKQEAAEIVREYERTHGEIKEGASGPPGENEESNYLDDLTLSLKSRESAEGAGEGEKNKRDGILKYFMNRAAASNLKARDDPERVHDPRTQWMKTFLVEHDPNWVKQRLRTGSGKPQVVLRSDVDDRRRALYASEGRGISSRSGGGSAGSAGGSQDTGNSNLDDASPRRKFQTQGW